MADAEQANTASGVESVHKGTILNVLHLNVSKIFQKKTNGIQDEKVCYFF